MDYYRHGHFDVRPGHSGRYVFITCPTLNNPQSFGVLRQVFKDLRSLEGLLRGNFKCWICYTGNRNTHIIRMLKKWGAQELSKSKNFEVTFFRKDL